MIADQWASEIRIIASVRPPSAQKRRSPSVAEFERITSAMCVGGECGGRKNRGYSEINITPEVPSRLSRHGFFVWFFE
jgi:hypothetical protein